MKRSLEVLAIKHLLTHPNDKSMSIWAKMNGTYGRKATREAIKQASQVLQACDPGFKPPRATDCKGLMCARRDCWSCYPV